MRSEHDDRAEKLAPSGASPRARLDQRRAALETAKQQVLSAQANLENTRAALAEAEAAREELTVLQRQLGELGPEEQRLRAQRERAALDLEDRTVVMHSTALWTRPSWMRANTSRPASAC
ncbi:MAG: hypothetical protein WAW54_13410 [Parvibaculum sedimenti]|uniref:hypothetical protein n=1 Tax=Parvibaculum sedimenti TaxID=2608632 RepID=UPI003BB4FEAF